MLHREGDKLVSNQGDTSRLQLRSCRPEGTAQLCNFEERPKRHMYMKILDDKVFPSQSAMTLKLSTFNLRLVGLEATEVLRITFAGNERFLFR